jgi:hypothetical protein
MALASFRLTAGAMQKWAPQPAELTDDELASAIEGGPDPPASAGFLIRHLIRAGLAARRRVWEYGVIERA